jgi:hypothetical protein
LLLWCLQALLFNHYPIEDRFAESALGANQQSFRFGQISVFIVLTQFTNESLKRKRFKVNNIKSHSRESKAF